MRYAFILVSALSLLLGACAAQSPSVQNQHIPPALSAASSQTVEQYRGRTNVSARRNIVVRRALESIGVPYRWGGTSPAAGFDCSGLIVYSHTAAGIPIPRTATAQMSGGRHIKRRQLQPADLVFFKTSHKSKSIHVGLYVGDGMFVHAPGKGRQVTRARLDNTYFKSSFIGARTYILNPAES